MAGRNSLAALLCAVLCVCVSAQVTAQSGAQPGTAPPRPGGETLETGSTGGERLPEENIAAPAGPGTAGDVPQRRDPGLGFGWEFLLPIGPGIPDEACCFPSGACIDFNPISCVFAGGIRGGVGSTCAGFVCNEFRGCCFPDLSCEPLNLADCVAAGGEPLGANTGCSPVTACRIEGACCLPDGSCLSRETLPDCLAMGGEWSLYQGYEPDLIDPCSTVTCTGACWIDPDGLGGGAQCVLNVTANHCVNTLGGNYQGHGSTGCSLDPNCGREVETVNVRRTHGGGPVVNAVFRKFDDQGGTRLLKSASLVVSGETIHRVVIVNISGQIGKPQSVQPLVNYQNELFLGPLAAAGIPGPLPVIDVATILQCPVLELPNPGDLCNIGTGGVFIETFAPLTIDVPPANLNLFVGAGETLSLPFFGFANFNSEFPFASVNNPINEFEGELTVIYEYAFTGACCHPCDGTCTPNLTEAACLAKGGIYQGDLTECTPGLCPVIGACCHPCDGTCIPDLTQAECLATGGTWQGACSTCTPGLCPIIGACCHPCDGTCIPNITEAACLATGGLWQGACSTCTPGLCPIIGACCHPCDGTCIPNITEAACLATGGLWQGACSTCTPGLCPIIGACCHPCDGTCTADLTQAECMATGGIWQGACTSCSPNPCVPIGACCHPCDGTCIPDLSQAECLATGGIWQGACSTCSPGLCPILGACCHPCDGTCVPNITQAACLATGGIWQGVCSTCSPNPCVAIGACCHPCNGVCVPDVTQAQCVTLAGGVFPGVVGIWRGPCSDCTEPCPELGACCLPDGTCEELTIAACAGQGGSFKGLCTTCDEVRCEGACCLCDGSCVDAQTVEECEAQPGGGFWQGLDTECADIDCGPLGACCLPGPDGECEDLIEICCVSLGGTWLGAGSNCASIVCSPTCTKGCTHKGSLIVYSKVEIRWDSSGTLLQDTFISLTNDHPDDVLVQFFFINGDPPLEATEDERAHPGWNFLDNRILLTGNQPVWWSSATGDGYGVSPFTVLDPGTPPGRPAMDGTTDRVMRGWIVGWAVNYQGEEVRWNHLSGTGTLVYYGSGGAAWEYIACAITSASEAVPNGGVLPNPGVLNFDGSEYCDLPSHLLLNFQAVYSAAWSTPQVQVNSDTDLTLHPLDADLRLNHATDGPPATWAKFDVWNENEVKFSGMGRCITCWDQTLLRFYAPPNHTILSALQTNHGKARIEGTQHPACPNSVPRALLGVYARWLTFQGGVDNDGLAAAGGNLIWMGSRSGLIQHDALADFPPEAPVILYETPSPFEAADRLIDQLLRDGQRSAAGASPAGR